MVSSLKAVKGFSIHGNRRHPPYLWCPIMTSVDRSDATLPKYVSFCLFQEGTYAELMASEGEFEDFVVTYTAKQLQQEQGL